MEYITTKEASKKWGISTIRITVLANEERIPGAKRLGKSWLIPASATKPEPRKPIHTDFAPKKTDTFSFPLYHFRPDWTYITTSDIPEQQQRLLSAESAVLECRFADAYPLLESIIQAPSDIVTEIGSLWNLGICSIALNKPVDFSKIMLRLQLLLSEDFPHRDDLMILLDSLKTYVESLSIVADKYSYCSDIHDQCLPMACMFAGYSQLTKETMTPNSADLNLLELNLRLLKNTGAVIVMEFMHLYLLGIYYLRHDIQTAKEHARIAVQIAFENKHYYPLVTYYRYFSPVLDPILAQYPEDFQNLCNELISQYGENFTAFLSSIEKYRVISKLKDDDIPYICAILMDLPNSAIAERMGVSIETVKRRLRIIRTVLGVSTKKELKDYLQHNI